VSVWKVTSIDAWRNFNVVPLNSEWQVTFHADHTSLVMFIHTRFMCISVCTVDRQASQFYAADPVKTYRRNEATPVIIKDNQNVSGN
jgi:hypothetical protein